ncbi:hypothetical protein CVD28_24545 [Bacillus sp. M6-12]|uniref:hypothetical protein n=1 Tax=Bacillus sp. M6-12 TaxID=2054166 RepID=UPI000C75B440|nr:hypothetical protein [Bacillus sp. M6-12]PLS15052.1 hypothetical protein CVD28_24545 [Bacillus sp. M6-12]
MQMNRDISKIRKEFLELNTFLLKHYVMKEDIISMGNLALFVDSSYNRQKWLEKKKNIKEWVLQKNANELNMFMANELYEIALRLGISDNLKFKLHKMTSAYKDSSLRYFDIVLDPYEFPVWFKRMMEYFPVSNKKGLYLRILKRLENYPIFQKREEQLAVSYFAKKVFHDEKLWDILDELESLIENKTENDIAWFMAVQLFRYSYPEMEKNNRKEEQLYTLLKLKEYKALYEKKELQTCDIFSDTMKKEISNGLFRSI